MVEIGPRAEEARRIASLPMEDRVSAIIELLKASSSRQAVLEDAAKDIIECFAHEDRDFPHNREISHSITGAVLTFGHLHRLSVALAATPPAEGEKK